jgi:putative membrane protein
MSIVRTALSLTSFGLTIFQVFEKPQQASLPTRGSDLPNFGIALVLLGIVLLTLGITGNVQFMLGLRRRVLRWSKQASCMEKAGIRFRSRWSPQRCSG